MTDRKSPLINRRQVLIGATAFAAPALIGPAIRAQENVLYVNTYGGSWTNAEIEAYFKPFTKETGIEVKTVTPVNSAKFKAQVVNKSYEWTVSSVGSTEFEQTKIEGLMEPIDKSVVDVSKIAKENVIDNYGINSVALSYLLVYRKDKFPNGGPKSWADFWDVKKFPGNRSMCNRSWTALGQALLADGVPLDKVYPLDVDRAFKKMSEIKPHIKVWWEQNTQSQQLIKDGEVDMIQMTSARAQELIDQGVPLEIVWNGAENYWSYWFISKGAPNQKAGWKLIDVAARPETQAHFCKLLPYGPSHADAFKFMEPSLAAKLPTTAEHLAQAYKPDPLWIGGRLPAIRERWSQWIAS